jgi:hypothetical protein
MIAVRSARFNRSLTAAYVVPRAIGLPVALAVGLDAAMATDYQASEQPLISRLRGGVK